MDAAANQGGKPSSRQAKLEAKRAKIGQDCAKKLEAAATALQKYLHACNDCNDLSGSELRGAADGRVVMIEELTQYRLYLESVYRDEN